MQLDELYRSMGGLGGLEPQFTPQNPRKPVFRIMLELQSAQDGVNLQPIGTILRPIKALILGNILGTKYAKNIWV